MFATIGSKIKTLLDGITFTSTMVGIYNYEKKLADEGYPYITISPLSGNEDMFDSNKNLLVIPYQIAVYFRNDTISTTEEAIRVAVDEIMTELRSDRDLTGSADFSRFEIDRAYTNDEQPTRVAIIKAYYSVLSAI